MRDGFFILKKRDRFPHVGFFILRKRDRFPHVLPEPRNILHSISYGTSPVENVCRLALGIETYATSVAGFLPSMQLHIIQRIPNLNRKQKRHPPIEVPAVVIKVCQCVLQPRTNTSL